MLPYLLQRALSLLRRQLLSRILPFHFTIPVDDSINSSAAAHQLTPDNHCSTLLIVPKIVSHMHTNDWTCMTLPPSLLLSVCEKPSEYRLNKRIHNVL